LRSRSLIHDIEVRELSELADRFRIALADRKAAIRHEGFSWYPHDSFGALSILNNMFTGRERWLRSLIGSEPVVDIGCGDGDLSFFLESLGPKVYAVDYAPTNYNLMQGVKALKSALHSSVRISSADLDARGELPLRECGLALFRGSCTI
jgi:2-polyprenyl-3-methyl-5-hydroxy-6-metoxy-1,4-benzoquinol methylase